MTKYVYLGFCSSWGEYPVWDVINTVPEMFSFQQSNKNIKRVDIRMSKYILLRLSDQNHSSWEEADISGFYKSIDAQSKMFSVQMVLANKDPAPMVLLSKHRDTCAAAAWGDYPPSAIGLLNTLKCGHLTKPLHTCSLQCQLARSQGLTNWVHSLIQRMFTLGVTDDYSPVSLIDLQHMSGKDRLFAHMRTMNHLFQALASFFFYNMLVIAVRNMPWNIMYTKCSAVADVKNVPLPNL